MDKREEARRLWIESGRKKTLKDIATKLSVPVSTVKSWKQRDAWGKDAGTQKDASKKIDIKIKRRKAQTNIMAVKAIEGNEELTDREKDFCAAFVHAPSAAQAAMKTGRYSTYESARQAAYEMMQKPAVVAEIKRLKEIKRATMLANGDDIVELLERIVHSDITAYVEFGRETVPVMGAFGPIVIKDEKSGENVALTKEVNTVRFKETDQVDGTVLSEVKQGSDGASVKLIDKLKAAELLYKIKGDFSMDKHRKAYDNAKLKLEQQKQNAGSEEAIQKLDAILSSVNESIDDD